MIKTFELETLKIRLNEADFQRLDLHQRIQRALRALILEGALAPGMKLPATRTLAKSLGVARDTVENAYVLLHRDGFIVRRAGSGSYVSDTLGMELRGLARKRIKSQELLSRRKAIGSGLSQRGRVIFNSGGVADQQMIRPFATGLPETRTFPTDVWERLQRQAMKDYRANVLLHGDPQGAEPLRKAIAAYLNLERGAKVSPDQILVLSSTRQSLFLCAQLLVDAGGPILMENPGYFGAKKAFEAAETNIVPVNVDEQGIRTDLLKADGSGANCVYVTPSHQYPTGVTLSLERRFELINWAAENNKWIIEDDYDSEFHYDGLPIACVQGLDQYQRTIYLGTFSKTLYPGLRMGYMAVPHELIDAFTYARSIMDGHTPQILQLTLARFMEDGHYNSHVRAMRKLYAGRREMMLNAISQHLGGIVTALRPAGGLQIPCLLEHGWSEEKTIRQAATAGIQLPGLSRLYFGEDKKQGWVLGYSSLAGYEIEAAMLRLSQALFPHFSSSGNGYHA
ncbi:PLP-dependent aminotransferase family protein [Xenorhabdus sp. DI]|uniref:MocR-like pyridoxine biosynthesis transcription factor PdxR n=1 Tax=Xenorhabdus doucetiae TaxID=351671 RepID=UPI0019A8D4E1|nr:MULTISPECIES: PLP-dependent aminotransferase family protein [unclassified Xenorhabdus]MBD2785222.1 PLP-dependent aminotransferase family protein [Xenorhabdus sp. 3]MBD2787641.1 PLP-dependent aminotransferase family protein [Xenorhabdus sp. DI]